MFLFEWWSDLPVWLRYGVAVVFLLVSTGLYFLADLFWPWGWVVGVILLLVSGPSGPEKRGYRF